MNAKLLTHPNVRVTMRFLFRFVCYDQLTDKLLHAGLTFDYIDK